MTRIEMLRDRWEKIQTLNLKAGAHSPDSTFCVMEAAAFVAGETWSDNPECVCSVIGAFMRAWNDGLATDADRDRLLKPLIPKLLNTRAPALEERRSLMAADWLVRVHMVAWLRLAGLNSQADRIVSLPEITSMGQIPSIKTVIDAAWDAARAAAGDAAGAAAGKKLASTLDELQLSAVALVERMCALSDEAREHASND